MISPGKIVMLWLVAEMASASELSSDSENWLRLERTSDWSRQQLKAQQNRGQETAPSDALKTRQPNPLVPLQEAYRQTSSPTTEEQLFQQQQLQQRGLQEQQRRALISDQHRQQALATGNNGVDRSQVQQQRFNMQQQNQLRGLQLQQQIQRGITR